MRLLPAEFFERDSPEVAPQLLNKLFVVGSMSGRISEVEAYTQDDPASHCFRGQTGRNEVMFGPAGHLYVYFIYGVHHCVNVVTGSVGNGQAVLVRGVVGINGPGRLTKAFGIDLRLNGAAATIYDDCTAPPANPLVGPRVGISRAVDWPRRWRLPPQAPKGPGARRG